MRYFEIVNESVSKDEKKIISMMSNAILKGHYWDKPAIERYPHLHDASADFAEEIAENWIDGEFDWIKEFPEKLSDMSSDEIIETGEFHKFITAWCKIRLKDAKVKLAKVSLTNGMYHVHRIMTVPINWVNDAKHSNGVSLGVYWTYAINQWDANSPWAKEEGHNVLISAYVKQSDVDWFHTYLAAMDWYSGDSEYEMRPNLGAPLHGVVITDHKTGEVLIKGKDSQFKA